MTTVTIYIDGACEPNPGHGGIGIVLLYGQHRKEISEYIGDGVTNNIAEITAAIRALEALRVPCEVNIYSDSQYLVKSMNGEFRKTKNTEYWSRLDNAIGDHEVAWLWVKGHNGDKENERANILAETAARRKS